MVLLYTDEIVYIDIVLVVVFFGHRRDVIAQSLRMKEIHVD